MRARALARGGEPLEQAPAMEAFGAGGAGELGQLAICWGEDRVADGTLFNALDLLRAVLAPQLYARSQAPVLAAQKSRNGQQPLPQAPLWHPNLPIEQMLKSEGLIG